MKIPVGLKPVQTKNDWSVYLMNDSISIAVFSTEKLGIMAVTEDQSPVDFLENIVRLNSDSRKLDHHFTMPDGTEIEYDVNSPNDSWVIQNIDDKPVDRKDDHCPLIEGDFLKNN